jgi:hypothetical protein
VTDCVEEPVITFQPWRRWKERSDSPVLPPCGGVYLFAHSNSGQPPQPPTLQSLPFEVVYVGDAKDLGKRPLTGRHHRIERYKELFGQSTDSLFVALAPLYETACADYRVKRILSFYIEATLAWNYTKRYCHPPAMHYKDKGAPPPWVGDVVNRLKGI